MRKCQHQLFALTLAAVSECLFMFGLRARLECIQLVGNILAITVLQTLVKPGNEVERHTQFDGAPKFRFGNQRVGDGDNGILLGRIEMRVGDERVNGGLSLCPVAQARRSHGCGEKL